MKKLEGIFEFSNLGRNKKRFTAKIKEDRDIDKAIKPHLLSKDIEWVYNVERNEGKIFVGGFREVGQFKRLEK